MVTPQLLVVPATLKGPKDKQVVSMIVDTGASATMIPPQIALIIGCDPAKSDRRIPIITASGLEYLPVIVINEIICLNQSVRNVEVVCHSLPPQSTTEGLLGLDFLIHVPAFQQFRAEILRLTRN